MELAYRCRATCSIQDCVYPKRNSLVSFQADLPTFVSWKTISALQNKPPAAKNAKGEDDKLLNDLYRARQAGLLEERCFALANIVLSLVCHLSSRPIAYAHKVSQKEQCDRMKAIETKTYSLLLEASRSFGFEFAFSEPMYFTWTLERFSKCSKCLLWFALIIDQRRNSFRHNGKLPFFLSPHTVSLHYSYGSHIQYTRIASGFIVLGLSTASRVRRAIFVTRVRGSAGF